MKRWWSSDIHATHDNILEHANRPYPDALHMLHRIAQGFNQKVRSEDTVIHLGDFMSRGNVKGKPSLPFKFDEVRRLFNGNWIFVKGNHDENNGVKCALDVGFTEIGPYQIMFTHVPLYGTEDGTVDFVSKHCHAVLCGHVHQKWESKIINNILHINVGVDVCRMLPHEDSEIVERIDKALKNWTKS